MIRTAVIILSVFLACGLHAASLSIEGSYTTNWKSTSPYTFKGSFSSKSETEYAGEMDAPWNGKNENYKGTITGKSGGPLTGDFVMTSSKRKFAFTVTSSGGNYTGDVTEGGRNVGKLDMRVSGLSSSSGGGGVDYSELVSEAVSKTTGITKDAVLELFKNKGISKDDVISICAVSEITKGNLDELYKKKKKFNTSYEFFKELSLEKEVKTGVDDLIKKIKSAMEDEKKKKK